MITEAKKASSLLEGLGIADRKTVTGHCDKHGDFEALSLFLPREQRWTCAMCPKCLEDIKAEEEAERQKQAAIERQQLAQRRISERFAHMAIPQKYCGLTFDDMVIHEHNAHIVARARKFVQNFKDIKPTGFGMFLYGNVGTGKTHLACVIAQELFKLHGTTCLYTTVGHLMNHIKDGYTNARSELESLQGLKDVELLILDELGANSGSSFEETRLFDLINYRTTHKLPTIFISNLPLWHQERPSIMSIYGERTFDRIQEVSIAFQFTGHSMRKYSRETTMTNLKELF